jgi:hypothetical protein
MLFAPLTIGLIFGLLVVYSSGLAAWSDALLVTLFVGLGLGLLIGFFGLFTGFTRGEIAVHTFPNEGIKRSMQNGLLGGLVCGLFMGLSNWYSVGLDFGLFMGLNTGFTYGLLAGGQAFLYHFALRLVLWHNNFAPLNYIRFLDYAATRIFLCKVGGGYIFVHRLLLEYFAARHQTSAHFLERSDQHRNHMWLARVMYGLLMVGMIAAAWWLDTGRRHQNDLSAWGLPSDLYTYQRQLKTLRITAPVQHLRWLKAELTTFAIKGAALQELTLLPPALRELDLSHTGLTSLAGLAGLEKLPHLTTLNFGHADMPGISMPVPSQLTTLTLSIADDTINSLAVLGKLPHLTTLDLRDARLTSIKMLSNSHSIKTLYLPRTVHSLSGLPTSVNQLVLHGVPNR